MYDQKLAERDFPRVFMPVLLFFWELFLVTALCCLFILFIEMIWTSGNERTHYAYFLFHLAFPPLFFLAVTWSTKSFRPARLLVCTVLAAAILTPLFTFAAVMDSLWILAACLAAAILLRIIRPAPRPRKRTVSNGRPMPEDSELDERLAQGRRRDRKTRTASDRCRPIPVNRNWPIERI
jgi:hypothetical protein